MLVQRPTGGKANLASNAPSSNEGWLHEGFCSLIEPCHDLHTVRGEIMARTGVERAGARYGRSKAARASGAAHGNACAAAARDLWPELATERIDLALTRDRVAERL